MSRTITPIAILLSFFLSGYLVQNPDFHSYQRLDFRTPNANDESFKEELSRKNCHVKASFSVTQSSRGNLEVPEFSTIYLSNCEELVNMESKSNPESWTFMGRSIFQNLHNLKEEEVYFFKISQYERKKDPVPALQSLLQSLKNKGYHTNLRLIPSQSNLEDKINEINFFHLESEEAYKQISSNKELMSKVESFNREYLKKFAYLQARALETSQR